MAEPFEETYLICELPVVNNESPTLYTRFGDYAGKLFVYLTFMLYVAGIALVIMRKIKNGQK